MKNIIIYSAIFIAVFLSCNFVFAQGPWNMPLHIAYSLDGVNFTNDQIFQDSSGVPSITIDTNGVLVCAFQWFPEPMFGPHWDSVAVKFSYDNGITWTNPSPCVFSGMPPNFIRPFDPAIVCTDNGQFRMYFSCGPNIVIDSTTNTYSAVSSDGINYTFEPNARFDVDSSTVIDPCVVKFNGLWHYSAPIGAPQDGAYHCTSMNGINFAQLSNITSDNNHVWGGNMLNNDTDLRFYGSTTVLNICYNSTTDGNNWLGYVNTNLTWGDPAVFKVGSGNYIIVYVGLPYSVGIGELPTNNFIIYPNPSYNKIKISNGSFINAIDIFNAIGQKVYQSETKNLEFEIDLSNQPKGIYFVKIYNGEKIYTEKIVIQ